MSREEGGWLLGHVGIDDRGRRARSHAGGEARCGCQVGMPWQLRCARVVRCAAVGLAPFCWAARGKGEVGAGLRASVLGRGREGKGAGWVEAGFGLVSGFLFSSFSSPFLFQTTLTNLNSNSNLNPNPSTQTKRTMHQHECTNKFILRKILITYERKLI